MNPTTDVFIQCVEAPARFPGRLGWYLPVFAGGPKGEPLPRERLLVVAEKMRADHERLYGGRWVVYQQTDDRSMVLEANRLRSASVQNVPTGAGRKKLWTGIDISAMARYDADNGRETRKPD